MPVEHNPAGWAPVAFAVTNLICFSLFTFTKGVVVVSWTEAVLVLRYASDLDRQRQAVCSRNFI